MKKILITLCTLLLIVSTASAQSSFSKDWKDWSLGKNSAIGTPDKAYNPCEQSKIYLSKSYKYQYSAIGCATVAAGLLVGYGSLNEKFKLNDEKKLKMTDKAKMLIIGGSIIGVISAILEINAIAYKNKAGKCLHLQASEEGAGLALVF